MLLILATLEVEIWRLILQGQPRNKFRKTCISAKKSWVCWTMFVTGSLNRIIARPSRHKVRLYSNNEAKRLWGITECLSNKQALSSNPSSANPSPNKYATIVPIFISLKVYLLGEFLER
jgi:hypothetical protein